MRKHINILIIPFKTINLETSTKNNFYISNKIITFAKQKVYYAHCPICFLKLKEN